MSPDAIAKCFVIIAESYPGRWRPNTSDPVMTTMDVWAHLLTDIDDTMGKAAVAHLCASGKYPPSVSEIRETALSLSEGGVAAPSAWESWERAIHGQCREPEEIRALEMVGGNHAIKTTRNIEVLRSNYIAAYKEITSRSRSRKLALPYVSRVADGNRLPEPEPRKLPEPDPEPEINPPSQEQIREMLKKANFGAKQLLSGIIAEKTK